MKTRFISDFRLKPWMIAAGFASLLVALGVYNLPLLLKNQLTHIIQSQTARNVSVGAVNLGVLPLRVSAQNLLIQDHNGDCFFRFDQLEIQLAVVQSIKNQQLVIDKFSLINPFININQDKNGQYNFQDIPPQSSHQENKPQHNFPFIIRELSLVGGKVTWQSQSDGRVAKQDISPINLHVKNISLVENAPFSANLTAVLAEGGRLEWQSNGQLKPLSATGHLKLSDLELARLHKWLTFDFSAQGVLSLDSDYQFSYTEEQFKATTQQSKVAVQDFRYTTKEKKEILAKKIHLESALNISQKGTNWQIESPHTQINSHQLAHSAQQNTGINTAMLTVGGAWQIENTGQQISYSFSNAHITGQNLQITETDTAEPPLIEIPLFSAEGISLNSSNKKLKIAEIFAKNAHLKLWLTPDGGFNYQKLFSTQVTPIQESIQKPELNKPAMNDLPIQVGTLNLENLNADFEDRTFKSPLSVNLKRININVNDFNNQSGTKMPFALSLGIDSSGQIKLNGISTLQPFSAQMSVNLNNLELAKYQPYYDKFVKLDIVDGTLHADGKLSINPTIINDDLGIQYQGNASIEGLLTRDQKTNKDLVKWENFTLHALTADTHSQRYSALELIFNRPYARLTISKDKSVNFDHLLVDSNASSFKSEARSPRNPVSAVKPWFKIGKIQIIDGTSDFSDLSLILPFAAHIESLDGGARDISTESTSNIKLALSGNAYELAPVEIKGELNPKKGNYDIHVSFNGLPMPLVSPYMVQFAGYKVEKGKMNLDLNYRVINQQLNASNKLLVDHFELGERVDNPNAVTIPIKLAIALLKDSTGKINFDVPVTGSLEDPRFNLGAVISDAFTNALGKIAKAPFSVVSSLFDDQEKNFSVVNFKAGEAKLDGNEQYKLDKIAKALQEHSDIDLEIKGAAFKVQDWPAIRDDALYDQLKKRRADELNKKSKQKIRPEYVQLSDTDFKRLLSEMFMEKFPLLADKSLFGTPKLKNQISGDFYEVAKQKLYEMIKPEEERLKGLAIWRAQSIAKYMVEKNNIDQNRIYILDTILDPPDANNKIYSILSLTAH